jgi:hypothetical protein
MFRSFACVLLVVITAWSAWGNEPDKPKKEPASPLAVDASQCGPETPPVVDPYERKAHILYLMFLTTSAGSAKEPEWSLQSVTNQEFDSCASCYVAAATIMTAIKKTPTINAVGWCFAKSIGAPEVSTEAPTRNFNRELPSAETVPLGRALSFPFVKQVR